MDTVTTISLRRSVREFTDKDLNEKDIEVILRAGQAGPSACNKRPWQFLVIREKKTLNEIADNHGKSGEPLRACKMAILILGDESLALDRAPEYYIVDAAIAAQNMILAATNLGIGSVWLGTWPQEEKMEADRKTLSIPENLIPQSLIAFGYPLGDLYRYKEAPFEKEKVHYEHF